MPRSAERIRLTVAGAALASIIWRSRTATCCAPSRCQGHASMVARSFRRAENEFTRKPLGQEFFLRPADLA